VKSKSSRCLLACAAALVVLTLLSASGLKVQAARQGWTSNAAQADADACAQSWFFAVSGDSRDCGDLIMPKIAQSIADHREDVPVEFYWHLGDFRALYRTDCDYAAFHHLNLICDPGQRHPMTDKIPAAYLDTAWDDFIEHQMLPFGTTPVFLAIGNHELINPNPDSIEGKTTRPARNFDTYQKTFQWWLSHPLLNAQREADAAKNYPKPERNTYYHFVKNGVDFISLDNAGGDASFSPRQLEWLDHLLKMDAQDQSIKTIIAGMHAALPLSTKHGHAMDKTEAGFCTGRKAYEMLFDAQQLDGPPEKQKHVYVLASHSHFFESDIYASPELLAEHHGKVLPGWIIGTAGAEQYIEKDPATKKDVRAIMYGYLQIQVRPDGTLRPRFKEVYAQSQPVIKADWFNELTRFCFNDNKTEPSDDRQSEKNKKPYDCSKFK
jgi:hypothetical protein